MRKLCFEEIIQYIDEYECDDKRESFFDRCEESQMWQHADAIVNSEFSMTFIHILDEHLGEIDTSKAKSILFSVLENTENPLLYSNICRCFIKNNQTLNDQENKRVEIIAKSRFELTNQNYIKEKSLEMLVLLSLDGKIGRFKVLSILEDMDENWATPLVVKSIKMLGLFYDKYPEEDILKLISKLENSLNPLILSESAHQTGLIYLRKALESTEDTNLIHGLKTARDRFAISYLTMENRDDALFYKLVIEAIISLLGSSQANEDVIRELEEVMSKRSLYMQKDDLNLHLEMCIFELVENIKAAMLRIGDIKSWLDISSEILSLAKIYSFERQTELLESFYTTFNTAIKNIVFVPKVQTAITHKLQDARYKLSLIKKNGFSVLDENEMIFIDAVLDYCVEHSHPIQAKKKELRDQILVSMANSNNISTEALTRLTEQLDQALEEETIVQFLVDQFNSLSLIFGSQTENSFFTGSAIGDEILKDITNEINTILPDYPFKKMQAYRAVCADLIRYNVYVNDVQRIDRGRRNRSFLFSKIVNGLGKDASEEDLQQDMYDFLAGSSTFAQFIEWEQKNVASGRVDIRYNFGDLRYPVEVKKEYNDVSPEFIKKMYISQAQTYTASYEQLGFFVVLDLTEKDRDEPPANIRDHFYITRLNPQKDLVVKHPDYVTVIIVSANRLTPTKRSTYSRDKGKK